MFLGVYFISDLIRFIIVSPTYLLIEALALYTLFLVDGNHLSVWAWQIICSSLKLCVVTPRVTGKYWSEPIISLAQADKQLLTTAKYKFELSIHI